MQQIKLIITSDKQCYCEPVASQHEWEEIITDVEKKHKKQLDALLMFYRREGHKGTCGDIAKEYSMSDTAVNSLIVHFNKFAKKYTRDRFQIIREGDNTECFWAISMIGRDLKHGFEWTVRPELCAAVRKYLIRSMLLEYCSSILRGELNNFETIDKDKVYRDYCLYIGEKIKTDNSERDSHFLVLLDEIQAFMDNDTEFVDKLRKETEGLVSNDPFNPKDVIYHMQAFFKASGCRNWLQKMYDEALASKHWVYEVWYPKYKKSVEMFAGMFDEGQTADTISGVTKEFFIRIPDNNISSNGKGSISKIECQKILSDWPIIYEMLKGCYTKGDVTSQDEHELAKVIKKHTNKNHPAALHRMWAGILPDILTTIITGEKFYDIYNRIRERNNALPPSSGSWTKDNKTLMDFFDARVAFKEPLHKALFAWYLSEKLNQKENDPNMQKYIKLLEANHNLILTGAPGTGKTYLAKRMAEAMGATEENENLKMVQFHPSYDYTDFVEGLRPKKDGEGFERVDGVFKAFCKKALSKLQEKYVFIIDEINRGELSKIFGELFFSIEPGYRGDRGRVETQYQNMVEVGDPFDKGFYVPENVYIIGTMNDIDRGVESMDFAIRRRFAWDEVTAESRIEMLKDKLPELANQAIKSMKALNTALEEKAGLSSAYHIGPAYYLKLENYDGNVDEKFESLWQYHIRGLIFEYLRGTRSAAKILDDLKADFDKYKE